MTKARLWRAAFLASTAAAWLLMALCLAVTWLARQAIRAQDHAEIRALYALGRCRASQNKRLRTQR